MTQKTPKSGIEELVALLKSLRTGSPPCPWASAQTIQSLLPYTIEETYELAHAADQGDPNALKSELGDLLYQVVFYAQIADEAGHFNLDDVARAMVDKHNARMPDTAELGDLSAEDVNAHWQATKQNNQQDSDDALANIPTNLPALLQAHKCQTRAAELGFDWTCRKDVFNKLEEELNELNHDIQNDANIESISSELGDLMFTCVNFARHYQIDSEACMRKSINKFKTRFAKVQKIAKNQSVSLNSLSLDQLEALWQQAKSDQ